MFPLYEVWGGWHDDMDFDAQPDFLEDCMTLADARQAVVEYHQNPARYAFIKEKETGNIVS